MSEFFCNDNSHICKICGKVAKNNTGLCIHIASHKKINFEDYYLKYIGKPGYCPECGKETKFISLGKGYYKYCSVKCLSNSKEVKEKRKIAYLKKYGVDNPFKSGEVKEKNKKTMMDKYGVDHPSKSPEIKEKRKETCISKYGVDNPSKSQEIKEKKKETCISNYGVDNPFRFSGIREKARDTCITKYGVDHPARIQEVRKKSRTTCLKRYGVDNPLKSSEIKEKRKETYISKYGVDHPSKSQKIQERKRHGFFNNLLSSERLQQKCIPLFSIEEYMKSANNYLWKCNTCNTTFQDHLNNGHIPRCPICYPKLSGTSIFEKKISDFCKQYYPNLIENDRTILDGKELDIYIPEINLAIECDGLYWHSELHGIDEDYHLLKTIECERRGIHLIHIFEDEWYNKQDIVESMLLTRMGKIKNKIYARKCKVGKVSFDESEKFLFENHLQGPINGKSLGLYYNDILVSILVYGKPRFNKNYDIEILRFCNKKNNIVNGGLSKLVSHLKGKIITYCDLRYSTGDGYIKSNFKILNKTSPNYYYLDNYQKRYSRLQFQKHKLPIFLENFDPNLTEWENMQLNDYDRIWDCGNLIFEKNSKNQEELLIYV